MYGSLGAKSLRSIDDLPLQGGRDKDAPPSPFGSSWVWFILLSKGPVKLKHLSLSTPLRVMIASSPETSPGSSRGRSVRKARRNSSQRTASTEQMFSDEDDLSSVSHDGDFAGGSFDDDDVSVDPDDILLRVDNYLKDFDGTFAIDAELKKLQTALQQCQLKLEELDQELAAEHEKRTQDIEEAKNNVRRTSRAVKDRMDAIDESKHASPEAEERRRLVSQKSEDDMLKAMASMKTYNDLFEEQKKKIAKKTHKREKLAIEMKLGARKALRRLKMVGVRARIEKENAEKDKKEKGPVLDMSEKARRERVYMWYTRTAMPNKKLLTEKVQKLPPDAGVTVEDIDLLPWDERGMRVNIAKMNQVMLGIKK